MQGPLRLPFSYLRSYLGKSKRLFFIPTSPLAVFCLCFCTLLHLKKKMNSHFTCCFSAFLNYSLMPEIIRIWKKIFLNEDWFAKGSVRLFLVMMQGVMLLGRKPGMASISGKLRNYWNSWIFYCINSYHAWIFMCFQLKYWH